MIISNISPAIPLWLGIGAGTLFLSVLLTCAVVTMRNRKIIKRSSLKK